MPTIDSPYIVIQTKEIISILKIYEHEAVEKEPLISAIFPFTVIGVVPGLLIMPTGYFVLGRDIIGLAISSLLVGNFLSFSDREVSRHKKEKHYEERIPSDKEFILSLVGKDYCRSYQPDNEGFLDINIMDFSPVYRENEDFEFKLVSPKGDSVDLFVPTDGISSLFSGENSDD
jgi:hypothetical protein